VLNTAAPVSIEANSESLKLPACIAADSSSSVAGSVAALLNGVGLNKSCSTLFTTPAADAVKPHFWLILRFHPNERLWFEELNPVSFKTRIYDTP
jgi:hypothetical protein